MLFPTPAPDGRGPQITDPKQMLMITRIIWAALVMGVTVFAVVIVVLTLKPSPAEQPAAEVALPMLLFYVTLGMTLVAIPLGLFIRGQVFKAGWVGDVVTPVAYQTGNIIAWACCEGSAFFGIIICMVTKSLWPYAIPPAIAYVMLLLLWPNGKAMFPPLDPYAPNGAKR